MDFPLYYGNSMRSVFKAGERLQLTAVEFAQLQVGDIVAVKGAERQYVHRIIEITAGYAVTMGDNNLQPDKEFLTPSVEFMLVTGAVDAQGSCRKIVNGSEGMRNFRKHQHLQRRRERAGRCLRWLEKGFFWRIKPDEVRTFGLEKCYFYRGKAVARRSASGALVYSSWKNRLLFYIPGVRADEQ